MNCDLAREALSARIDGEREPVPSVRVDEHLACCAQCQAWFDEAKQQAAALRRLVGTPSVSLVAHPPEKRSLARPRNLTAVALFCVGLTQVVIAVLQALGLVVGLHHMHGADGATHLLNESTAWSIALGLAMMVAARWPVAVAGLAATLIAFVGVLGVYVVIDALAGTVTLTRVLTHVPVLLGAVLSAWIWRRRSSPNPAPEDSLYEPDIVLPPNASRGRRRGHLFPTDDSAA